MLKSLGAAQGVQTSPIGSREPWGAPELGSGVSSLFRKPSLVAAAPVGMPQVLRPCTPFPTLEHREGGQHGLG